MILIWNNAKYVGWSTWTYYSCWCIVWSNETSSSEKLIFTSLTLVSVYTIHLTERFDDILVFFAFSQEEIDTAWEILYKR